MNRKSEQYIALSGNRIGIPLTMGKLAIIDAADYGLVRGRRWQAKVGCKGKTHYARTSLLIDGVRKTVAMHSLILPKREGLLTDHIDGDGLNNTRENLRYATFAENQRNRVALRYPERDSIYKGVEITSRWHEGSSARKWRALISLDGQKIYIGSYHCEHEAALAYNRAAIKYHGEFARLNVLSPRHTG